MVPQAVHAKLVDRVPLSNAIERAVQTIEIEGRGLRQLKDALQNSLGRPFEEAVDLVANLPGRLIVTGIGKSGHIARKISATLASTGTPSFYMHPAEASHGDLGMVASDDAILALSWSGETAELRDTLTYCGRHGIPLIAFTANSDSALGTAADVTIEIPKAQEACPHQLAPTTSALLQLALGDALALSLLDRRGFTPANFRKFHPGGKLGAALLTVRDVMRPLNDTAIVSPADVVQQAILAMTGKSLGCAVVASKAGEVVGIVTDGDLRRHLNDELLRNRVDFIMSADPESIEPAALASVALARMSEEKVTALVVAENGKLAGLVTMHRLLELGLC